MTPSNRTLEVFGVEFILISVSIGLTGLISGVVSRDSNGSIDIQAGTISYDGSEIKQTFAFGQNSWNGFEFGKCEESDISRQGSISP